MTRTIGTLGVIGLGLIGGSVCRAAQSVGCCERVVGWNRNPAVREEALKTGVVDAVTETIGDLAATADLLVLAVPMLSFESVLAEIAGTMRPGTLLTDAGSAKVSVIAAARQALSEEQLRGFVPAHPIAGSEKSGLAAAQADLYRGHKVILTPTGQQSGDALVQVRAFWTALGADVQEMDADHHDDVLALTSHLPHLLAYALVDTLAGEKDNREIFRYAAGGFRDFTRIASSDPIMWHDIFRSNRVSVLSGLDLFLSRLRNLRDAVDRADSEEVLRVLTRARSSREYFLKLLEERENRKPAQITFVSEGGTALQGELRVPGDKSISHRSIMLGSIAEGMTEVSGFLEGEDALATLQAFRDMGVVIEGPEQGRVRIHGVGLHGLQAPRASIYVGNSGTSIRLLSGLLAGQSFDSEMSGDESLARRPMRRVTEPLSRMGARIGTAENGCPPIRIQGGASLQGIHYDMPVASAQVKSALLLAGLYAEGETSITEPAPTRDHSERMLSAFGCEVVRDGNRVTVRGGATLRGQHIVVPADISSAAFFLVAGSIQPGSDLLLTGVGINPTRTGVIDILRLMGADISLRNERKEGGEPVADLGVRYAPLRGIKIPEALVPLAIDEFPVLFVAAACAEGETVLTGAEELRVKESDRIQVMADGLAALGIQAEPQPDGVRIQGGALTGGRVESHGDHRIAMAFSVAGLRASGPIVIGNCANVATSFPGFVEIANRVGMQVRMEEADS